MRLAPLLFVVPSVLLVGCAEDGAPAQPIPAELVQCAAPEGEEPTGEACQPLLCESICTVGAYLGCAGAWAACGLGDTLTVGALTIPCTPLIGVACAASPLGAAACIAREC